MLTGLLIILVAIVQAGPAEDRSQTIPPVAARTASDLDGLDQVLSDLSRDVSGLAICDRSVGKAQAMRFERLFGRRVRLLLERYHRDHPVVDPIVLSSCEPITSVKRLREIERVFDQQLKSLEGKYS